MKRLVLPGLLILSVFAFAAPAQSQKPVLKYVKPTTYWTPMQRPDRSKGCPSGWRFDGHFCVGPCKGGYSDYWNTYAKRYICYKCPPGYSTYSIQYNRCEK